MNAGSRYRLAGAVEGDLLDIFDYVSQGSRARAQRLVERFYSEFEWIAEHPKLFRLQPALGEGIRAAGVGKYRVLYRIREDEIVIERVLHGARNLDALLRRAAR